MKKIGKIRIWAILAILPFCAVAVAGESSSVAPTTPPPTPPTPAPSTELGSTANETGLEATESTTNATTAEWTTADPNAPIIVTKTESAEVVFKLDEKGNSLAVCSIFHGDEADNVSLRLVGNTPQVSTDDNRVTLMKVDDWSCKVTVATVIATDDGIWYGRIGLLQEDLSILDHMFNKTVTVQIKGNYTWSYGQCMTSGGLTCGAGKGNRTKTGTCTTPDPNPTGLQVICDGPSEGTEECDLVVCPVNCQWAAWSNEPYGSCVGNNGAICGAGQKTRTRQPTQQANEAGTACDEADGKDTDICQLGDCPVTSTQGDVTSKDPTVKAAEPIDPTTAEPGDKDGENTNKSGGGGTTTIVIVVFALCVAGIIAVLWYIRRRRDSNEGGGDDAEGQKYQEVPLNEKQVEEDAPQVYGQAEDKFLEEENRPIVKNVEKPAEVKAPEVQAPEVQAPEVKAPEVQAPEVQAPEVQAPEAKAPEVVPEQAPSTSDQTEAPKDDTP